MERVQRLYDCITEVSDQYIQEAESVEMRQGKTLNMSWKKWGSMAAALLVVVGIGLAFPNLFASSSSDASAPAMSEPAASAPAAEEILSGGSEPMESQGSVSQPFADRQENVGEVGGIQNPLRAGMEIRLSAKEAYILLTPEQAEHLELPENLKEAIVGDVVCWLVLEDGVYVPSEEPTKIAMYACAPDLSIVSNGEQYFVAVIKEMP